MYRINVVPANVNQMSRQAGKFAYRGNSWNMSARFGHSAACMKDACMPPPGPAHKRRALAYKCTPATHCAALDIWDASLVAKDPTELPGALRGAAGVHSTLPDPATKVQSGF